MRRALISVYDKTDIVGFVRELSNLEFEIVSTGGTREALKKAGIQKVKHVSDITEFPELIDGRIKTQHPRLMAAILAQRDKEDHMRALGSHGIEPIDLVACNLYPFERVIEQGSELETALEHIDIGGPNMIRAAAKNFGNVVVVTSPNRYDKIIKEYRMNGDVSLETRRALAVEAFRETARYDSAIFKFLENTFGSKDYGR